ncbi:anthranilate synthase component I family protein [Microterricola viridarii]|uniref:Anthranilate synthase component 1 n=1 Tax=Microterricola viridarii TaxID=412690 RepID=A0A1H1VU76_9MICO|nr:anthranilate synthase component I family protein [Microterricola viridarii]SDS87980.1 anthranilate synthase component 1 [Microterricola viridarii]
MLELELPGWLEPARVFAALYGSSPHAFWLDGGAGAESGTSYMGAPGIGARVVTASVQAGTLTVSTLHADGALDSATGPGGIFDFLRAELGQRAPMSNAAHESAHELPGFRLGWVGWLGYELGAAVLGTPAHPARTPDAALLEIDRCLAFDHATETVTLQLRASGNTAADAAADAAALEAWSAEITESLIAAASAPLQAAAASTPAPEPRWRHKPDRYAELIAECQAAIYRGDAYQLCLTNEIRVDVRPEPLEAYLRLRASSPTHHGGLLRLGEVSLLSASPEQFLAVTAGGHVTTKPIKGTRRRASGLARDLELRAELESSDKERAENLMIVDLMRNDLGKISRLGSVGVSKLLAVESYAHVHQLVSTIESQLADGLSGVDAVEASFPAGSMTGAPKISAMRILDGLEQGPRGIYSGAFGYFGLDGAVDLAMVIRSIVLDAAGASIGTGGGITALSVAAEEIEETQIKAAALLAVLGA